jgi:hypothetical protein
MFTKSCLHCKLTIFLILILQAVFRILKRCPKVPDEASPVLFRDPYHSWTQNSWVTAKVNVAVDIFEKCRRYVDVLRCSRKRVQFHEIGLLKGEITSRQWPLLLTITKFHICNCK